MAKITPKSVMQTMRKNYDLVRGRDFVQTNLEIFRKYKRNVAGDVGGALQDALDWAERKGYIISNAKVAERQRMISESLFFGKPMSVEECLAEQDARACA